MSRNQLPKLKLVVHVFRHVYGTAVHMDIHPPIAKPHSSESQSIRTGKTFDDLIGHITYFTYLTGLSQDMQGLLYVGRKTVCLKLTTHDFVLIWVLQYRSLNKLTSFFEEKLGFRKNSVKKLVTFVFRKN